MSEQSIKDLKKDISLLLHKAQEMLELTENGFMKNKLASLDQSDEIAREIHAREDILTAALVKMASSSVEARALLSVPVHIEESASCIKRITENIRVMTREGMLFSDRAVNETGKLFTSARGMFKKSGEAAVTGARAAIDMAMTDADAIQRMAGDFATAHEDRLVTGECSPRSSSTYLSILHAFEDMGTHIKDAVTKLSGK